MKYSYTKRAQAHYGDWVVTVPDQVADDQKSYDGVAFPARRGDNATVRVVLRGDLYGLHTGGTGDMVVTSEDRKNRDRKYCQTCHQALKKALAHGSA